VTQRFRAVAQKTDEIYKSRQAQGLIAKAQDVAGKVAASKQFQSAQKHVQVCEHAQSHPLLCST